MKKTIVALAVAAVAATSANAATIYNQDGTKVDVNGSVRFLLKKETDKRTDLVENGSRLEFKASHDLGNGLSALGYARLDLAKEAKYQEVYFDDDAGEEDEAALTVEEKSKTEIQLTKAYVGFGFDGVGQLTFGKQATNGDDLGVANYTYDLGGVNKVVATGDKVVRFTSADFGGFKFGLDYVFAGKADKKTLNNRAVVLSAFYDRKFGDVGFKFEAGLSNAKTTQSASTKAFTVGSEVSYGPVALGVDYSQSKFLKTKTTALLVGAKYQVTDMVKVYGNYEIQKEKAGSETVSKTRELALGVGYQLHKNVETFLEGAKYQYKDADGDKASASKVQVGLRVHF